MTERQRPGKTARSFLNSLTDELVEERQALEKLSSFLADDCIDLRRGHTGRCQKSKVDLHARSRWNGAIELVLRRHLLARLEVDLDAEGGLGPYRSIESQPESGADPGAADFDLPEDIARTRRQLDRNLGIRCRRGALGEELDVPFVVAGLHRLGEVRRRALAHDQHRD